MHTHRALFALEYVSSDIRLYYMSYNMIFFGHFCAHAPQFVHFSGSICAILSTTLTASNSQTFSHILHPIHPTEHAFMTSLPLSLELHCTRCFWSYGTSSIRCFGHTAIHLPQALHASLSTTQRRLPHESRQTDMPLRSFLLQDIHNYKPSVRRPASCLP